MRSQLQVINCNYIYLNQGEYSVATKMLLCSMLLVLSACTALAVQDSQSVNICLRQPQRFVCTVPKQVKHNLTRLEWKIDFQDSQSRPASIASVTKQYLSNDEEGKPLEDERRGISFMFNLTSNNLTSLVSVMTVTVHNANSTALINDAIMSCTGSSTTEIIQGVFHFVDEGPPSPPEMKLNQNLMKLEWNPVNETDSYFIRISSSIDSESESISTSNTSIHLSMDYNQDYNISLMATNCAGNSTPVETSIRVGHCILSTTGLDEIEFFGNGSHRMEGSHVYFSCRGNEGESSVMVATCMRNGSWIPDPYTYVCNQNHTEVNKIDDSNQNRKIMQVISAVLVVALVAGILLTVSIVIIMALKVHWKKSSQRIKGDNLNFYNDFPRSDISSESQELGIYSLLQPEQHQTLNMETRQHSTDAAIVYADVGSTLSRDPNTNANISLQLYDDRVQYADIKHHPGPELKHGDTHDISTGIQAHLSGGVPVLIDKITVPDHLLQPTCTFESSEELPPPLPPKIADFDEEMMSSNLSAV